MKKYNAFSIIEVVIVIAIISILTMIAIPSTAQIAKYQIRNSINNKNVILLSAVDSWKRDNFDNTKKPITIHLDKNTQNLTVLDYIKDESFYEDTNIVRTYDSGTSTYTYDIKPISYLKSKSNKNRQIFISLTNNKLILSDLKSENISETKL